ncbi:little elongation complex subunit 2 isoform X2 [Anolis carolinensis]
MKPAREAEKPPAETPPFQDPRVPFPYFSSLTDKDQRRYLFLLSKFANANNVAPSKQKDYSQYLQMKEFVDKEVAEFLKFAQNAAKSCTKDYEDISEEALLYTEKFLSSRLDCVKRYPELYTLCDITSIMGGKFCPELTLTFEKSLLALGKVNLVKRHFPKLPASIQLPVHHCKNDVEMTTPEQRAAAMHNDVSTDANAEKLAAKYCPQVVLTSESLYTLLNNHGLDYKEQWELPVSVKTLSGTGLKPVKVVYVDPPLPKKEMTVREKNQVFHEFLASFHTTKQSTVLAHAAVLDRLPEDPLEVSFESCQGRPMQVDNSEDLDFGTDFTELETFASTPKLLNASRPEGTAYTKPGSLSKTAPEHPKIWKEASGDTDGGGKSKPSERRTRSQGGWDFSNKEYSPRLMETEPDVPKSDTDCNPFPLDIQNNVKEGADVLKEESPAVLSCCSDIDDDALVIDTECKSSDPDELGTVVSDPNTPPCSRGALTAKPEDQGKNEPGIGGRKEPQQETNAPSKRCRRLSKKCDPLGQILKMQTELLKPPSLDTSFERHLHPVLPSQEKPQLKPSTPSTPNVEQRDAADPGNTSKLKWTTYFQGSQKGDHWDVPEEDRSCYEPPPQDNLVYKLFSLDNLLLLVRCRIHRVEVRPRNKKAKVRRHFPVFVLPKLEYQAFYGAEALTEGEVCRLWMEGLLHSNTSYTLGHIDALTSKLFLLEQLSAEVLKKRFGAFKPANSLNILQHILKIATGLQEGSYLLAHVAGDSCVSVYKSSEGKANRRTYNLHAAHADLPGVPPSLSVPWIPLDPNVPLPYHFAQGRVPCTFPPKLLQTTKNQKGKAQPQAEGTPSRRETVPLETNNNHPHPFRKRHSGGGGGGGQANPGPNWKVWKKHKNEPT